MKLTKNFNFIFGEIANLEDKKLSTYLVFDGAYRARDCPYTRSKFSY